MLVRSVAISPIPGGLRRHQVTVQNPGVATPDNEGGFSEVPASAVPSLWQVAITSATARDMERFASGTVLAQGTRIVTGPYRSDITTKTQLVFNGRRLDVIDVQNPDERNIELVLTCVEKVT